MLITENFNIVVSSEINDILEADRVRFNISSKNSLINAILSYYLRFEASKSEEEIRTILRKLKLKIKYDDLTQVIEELKKTTVKKVKNPVKLNFRLNKDTFVDYEIYLEDREKEKVNFTLFFRELFQWYCDKKQFEREKIICSKVIEEIEYQLREDNFRKKILKLRVKEFEAIELEVVPLGIAVGKNEAYSYLLGYTSTIDKNTLKTTGDLAIYPIRISNITSIKTGKRFEISFDTEEVKEDIYSPKKSIFREARKMVQDGILVYQNNENIEVALTERGKEMLEIIVHNRPFRIDKIKAKEKNGEYIYEFKSSYLAVKNYFFNFGKECRILYPIELSEEFKNGYNDAFESYSEI